MQHFSAPLLALPLLFVASCAMPQLAVEPTYAWLDSNGDIAVNDSGQPLVRNSFDDMGLSGEESSLALRVDAKWGMPHLTLSTQAADWSGTGQVTDFGEISGPNIGVESETDLAIHRAIVTFDVVPGRTLELGLGLGVSVIDVDARVTATLTEDQEDVDEVIPIPVLALRVAGSVWRIQLEGLLSGMAIAIDGEDAKYLDVDLAARIRLFELGPVDTLFSLGYRRIDLDVEYENDGKDGEVDVVLDGIYLGLRFSF